MGDITVTLTGDEARLLRAMDKVIEREQKLRQAMEEGGQTSQKEGKKHEDALDRVSNRLTGIAAGYLSVTAVMGGVRRAINEITETLDKNRQAAQNTFAAFAQYSSISKLDASDRKFVMDNAGALTLPEATGIVTLAQYQGVARAEQKRLLEMANAAKAVGEEPQPLMRATQIMQGAGLSGYSLPTILDFISRAAAESVIATSPYANQLSEIISLTPKVKGVTDEEQFAATSAMFTGWVAATGTAESPEKTRTAMRNFLTRIQGDPTAKGYLKKMGLEDKSLAATMAGLSSAATSEGFNEEKFFKAFGMEGGASLLMFLRNREKMAHAQGLVPGLAQTLARPTPGTTLFEERAAIMLTQDPGYAEVFRQEELRQAQERKRVAFGYDPEIARAQTWVEEDRLKNIEAGLGSERAGRWARAFSHGPGVAPGPGMYNMTPSTPVPDYSGIVDALEKLGALFRDEEGRTRDVLEREVGGAGRAPGPNAGVMD